MQNILNEIYDQYNHVTPNAETLQEIEAAHQTLIRSLEKPERKLILRIMDGKDLISGVRARESFTCGFWLAWRLFAQLHNYDSGRSLEENLNVGGRFAITKEKLENEQQI